MAKKARNGKIYIPAPRSAAQYPAGVSAASCPNYPFCNLAPVSFITRKQQKQKKNKKTTTASTIPSATSPLWVDSFYIKQFLTILFMATNYMNLEGGPSWLWLWSKNSVNLGGSSWIRQHCRLPRRSQCCCLPRISLLLNNKVLGMSELMESIIFLPPPGCTLCASRAPERLHNEN